MELTHFSKLLLFLCMLAEFKMATGQGGDVVFIVTTLTLQGQVGGLPVSLLNIKAIVGSVSPGGERTK